MIFFTKYHEICIGAATLPKKYDDLVFVKLVTFIIAVFLLKKNNIQLISVSSDWFCLIIT
ncbi:hypothetical protein BpHYR1_008848 [Brachionus plicatilis]|uniref:Uncharacterized protein n=1 Tax=Brachionus plicatilis TaxID=10195 RepID=A0A3M7T5M9_BRAPC|nr:hypothetical protein BpHYR1_008848 [Brachionus plicatilis]